MTTQPAELTPALTGLTINDAMRPGIVSCRAEEELATVAAAMVAHGIHAAVLEPLAGGCPLILTDLELIRAGLERLDGDARGDVAHEPAVGLASDSSLEQAVAKMSELYVAHLLVVDPASGAPCGVISSFDVVSVLGGHSPTGHRSRPAPDHLASGARALREARASDVMHPGVVTCAPDASLWTVARSMAEHRVHCIAVAGVGEAGAHGRHLSWGLISDMELVLAAHRGALDEAAATIATTAPPAVNESDPVERAAQLMVTDQTRHVVVVGPSGVPSGMISTLDVARILAGAA